GRSHEPATPWIRGGTAVLLLLVMAVYMTMLGGDVSETWSLFEHLLTPLVVFVDACFVSASAARAKWWFPFTWVSLPLCYLIYYIADGLNMYGGMLNPDNDDFAIDRKSTRLNSSHVKISYAVFCLKKKKYNKF